MSPVPRLVVLAPQTASESEFVEYWSSLYNYPLEQLYDRNIGKPLTPERILALFEWKNGGTIAQHKQASIRRNYIEPMPQPPKPPASRDDLVRFICGPGGAIWRIFWLHCQNPARFPIFDQHVYRAMQHIRTGKAEEIPTANRAKAMSYVNEYLPFHDSFKHANKKRLDEALWSYGKYLTRYAI